MTNYNLTRALRFYYKTGRMSKIVGTNYGYRFLTGWK